MESIDQSFRRSLSGWIQQRDTGHGKLETYDEVLSWCGANVSSPAGDPQYPGHQNLALIAIRALFSGLSVPFDSCRSPIERMFFSTVLIIAYEHARVRVQLPPHFTYEFGSSPFDTLIIEPQAQIGQHVVEFLLIQESLVYDFKGKGSHARGAVLPGPTKRRGQLIVQCDGTESDEMTNERALWARRTLEAVGYRVKSYTGADLRTDVFRCAAEALTQLNGMVYPSREQARPL
jgi:hypothetical protein